MSYSEVSVGIIYRIGFGLNGCISGRLYGGTNAGLYYRVNVGRQGGIWDMLAILG